MSETCSRCGRRPHHPEPCRQRRASRDVPLSVRAFVYTTPAVVGTYMAFALIPWWVLLLSVLGMMYLAGYGLMVRSGRIPDPLGIGPIVGRPTSEADDAVVWARAKIRDPAWWEAEGCPHTSQVVRDLAPQRRTPRATERDIVNYDCGCTRTYDVRRRKIVVDKRCRRHSSRYTRELDDRTALTLHADRQEAMRQVFIEMKRIADGSGDISRTDAQYFDVLSLTMRALAGESKSHAKSHGCGASNCLPVHSTTGGGVVAHVHKSRTMLHPCPGRALPAAPAEVTAKATAAVAKPVTARKPKIISGCLDPMCLPVHDPDTGELLGHAHRNGRSCGGSVLSTVKVVIPVSGTSFACLACGARGAVSTRLDGSWSAVYPPGHHGVHGLTGFACPKSNGSPVYTLRYHEDES